MLRKRLFKIIGWLTVLSLSLVGGGYVVAEGILLDEARQLVDQLITDQLPPEYALHYDEVNIDWEQRSIAVEQLTLRKDSAAFLTHQGRYHSLQVPGLRLQVSSLWSLLDKRELIIERILLAGPRVSVIEFTSPRRRISATVEFGDLLQLVAESLKLFEIRNLTITDAEVHYDRKLGDEKEKFSLRGLDLQVDGFMIDSTATRTDFLNAQSIELDIGRQEFYLDDGIHRCSFAGLRLSTRDSLLEVRDFVLEATDNVADPTKAVYDIQAPSVSLRGLDYERAYTERHLHLDQLLVQGPLIGIREASVASDRGSGNQRTIQQLLERIAPRIGIDHVRLERAQVCLNFQPIHHRTLQFNVDYFDLFGGEIDAEHLVFSRQRPGFRDFDLRVSDFNEWLPNERFQLSWASLRMNSAQRSLVLNGLSYEPASGPAPDYHKVEKITLAGVNYLDVLFGGALRLGRMDLVRPHSRIAAATLPADGESQPPVPADLRNLWSGWPLSNASLNHLKVTDGRLRLGDQLLLPRYTLWLDSLRLQEDHDAWTDFYSSLDLRLIDPRYQTDGQEITTATLRTNGRRHSIAGFSAYTQTGPYGISAAIDSIELRTPDPDHLLRDGLFFDTVEVGKLRLQVEARPVKVVAGQRSTAPPIQYLAIEEAEIDALLADSSRLYLADLSTSLRLVGQPEALTLRADSIAYQAPGFDHHLYLRQLEMDTQAYSFTLRDLRLTPVYDSLVTTYPLTIPRIRLQKWDREAWNSDSILALERIEIVRPAVDFTNRQPASDTGGFSLPFPLRVARIEVTDGQFSGSWRRGEDTTLLELPRVNAGLDRLRLSGSQVSLGSVARDLSLHLNDGFTLQQPGFDLGADRLDYRNKTGSLALDGLRFTDQAGRLTATLDHLTTESLAVDRLIEESSLVAGAIALKGVDLVIRPDTGSTQAHRELPTRLALPLQKIAIGKTEVGQAKVALLGEQAVTATGLRLSAAGLRTDSTLRLDSLSHHYDELNFAINDLTTRIGRQDVYELRQSLSYSSADRLLTLDSVKLSAEIDREDYTDLLEVQEDYFDVALDRVQLTDWRWEDALRRPLRLQTLRLLGLRADIYRDQRIPHPERPVPSVQEQLEQITLPFSLDSLTLRGTASFTIQPPERADPGRVTFPDLRVRVTNLTNDSSRQDRPMTIHASAKLFGQLPLSISGTFNLTDPLHAYRLRGTMSAGPIASMNEILKPTANLRIRSGRNRRLTFDLNANDEAAIGEMFFRYRRLKFRIMDDTDQDGNLGKAILSFWANRLVRSNNPSFFNKRLGYIYYEPNPNRAIFNYWSRAFMSGVISSLGVKNNRKYLRRLGIEQREDLDYQQIFEEGF